MSSTELARREHQSVALFAGATPAEIIGVAADAAQQFSDVVKKQRMFKRIGESDHIQIEAWQTIGALTGVLADDGHVTELPWPQIEPLGEEPPAAGREPHGPRDGVEWQTWKAADIQRRHWEHHRDLLQARALGRTFGFKAEFRAAKGGAGVGWGEGRCTRSEPSKVSQEDYALASMAQTRGQSRALGAPLKFVVKLAGYETTPAEELDGATGTGPAPAAPDQPWGPVADDKAMEAAAQAVASLRDGIDANKFVLALGQKFDGVPEAVVTALRGLGRYVASYDASKAEEAPQQAEDVSRAPSGPDPRDVYPEGHYQGD